MARNAPAVFQITLLRYFALFVERHCPYSYRKSNSSHNYTCDAHALILIQAWTDNKRARSVLFSLLCRSTWRKMHRTNSRVIVSSRFIAQLVIHEVHSRHRWSDQRHRQGYHFVQHRYDTPFVWLPCDVDQSSSVSCANSNGMPLCF